MSVCVQDSYKSPERQLFSMQVQCKHFFLYLYKNTTSHYLFSILTDGTLYFVGIVDDMDSLVISECSVGNLLIFFYPLTRWGIFDQI